MMKWMVIGGMTAVLSVGAAMAAQSPEPASVAPTVAAAADADEGRTKMICRTEQTTGSRLAKTRRCLTAAQWEEVNRQNRDMVERAQAQGTAAYDQ